MSGIGLKGYIEMDVRPRYFLQRQKMMLNLAKREKVRGTEDGNAKAANVCSFEAVNEL